MKVKTITASVLVILFGLFMCLLLPPARVYAAEIEIDATNFPDEKFRSYVSSCFDQDGNGKLSSTEIAEATGISVDDYGISSFKGVEHLTALTYIYCQRNSLSELDVSKNTDLKTLVCYENQLTALNVSKNTKLEYFSCSDNMIGSLDVTKNTALKYLYCNNNQLTVLNVTKNTLLETLYCGYNKLTELDLSRNPALKWLDFDGDRLSSVDVSKNTGLRYLNCSNNPISTLDLSETTGLFSLYCEYTNIKSLNASHLTQLECLWLCGSPVSSIDVSGMEDLDTLNLSFTKIKEFTLPRFVESFRFYGNPGSKVTLMSTGPYYNGAPDDVSIEYTGKGEVYYEYHMTTGGGGNWRIGVDTAVSINGEEQPKVTKQPVSAAANEGTVTFSVETSGSDLHYKWYECSYWESSGWNWSEVWEAGEPTLTVDADEDKDGTLYFCYIYNENGRVCSNVVSYSYLCAPYITLRPGKHSVAEGSEVTLSVGAHGGNLSYQWRYRKPGETEWIDVSAASGKTADYTFTAQVRHNGYKYKCVVQNELGTVETTPALLEVWSKPVIVTQPTDKTVAVGKTATFKVTASGGDLTYQWQYCKAGESAWNIVAKNGNEASYSLTTEARHNGYQYRCLVSNAYGDIYSASVLLTVVTAKPVITTQPKSITVAVGKTASFTVTAKGDGIDYLWLYRKPGESGWIAVSAAAGKTANYTLTVAAKHNGYQYRCRVRNAKGIVYTNTVTLSVENYPAITTQPTDKTVNEGETVSFKVVASKATDYQWQYLKPGETKWKNVTNNGTSATYKLTTQARHNGYEYRCQVSNSKGSVYSDNVKLKVNPKPVITLQPVSVTVKAGEKATFSLMAEGTPLSYQWFYQKPGESNWNPVTNNGTNATYKLTTASRHNGYKYKCEVTNTAGTVTSKIVTLTVN